MKIRISTLALVLAIIGSLSLTACSKQYGCYYAVVSENPARAFISEPAHPISNTDDTACLFD